MKHNYRILFTLIVSLFVFDLFAQDALVKDYPVIGEPCPQFTLTDVQHYGDKTISLADLRGKWVILDFWNTMCKPCITSFPKVNELQREFINDVQFILVGNDDPKYYPNSRKTYESIRKYNRLELAVAFDTTLFQRFGVSSVPHIVIIDDHGVVRSVTYKESVNSFSLKALLRGDKVEMTKKYNDFEQSTRKFDADMTKPLLLGNNGGSDTSFLYRAVLSRWTPDMTQKISDGTLESFSRAAGYQAAGTTVGWLYNLAYIGRDMWTYDDPEYKEFYKMPILEVKDSGCFTPDFLLGVNVYNYSTLLPPQKSTKKHLQDVIQSDLRRYFGYDAVVETRECPYWSLVLKSDRKRLRAKGVGESTGGVSGYKFRQITSNDLTRAIASYFPFEPSFVDETGLLEKIDIDLDAYMFDFESVKASLEKAGLMLVKKTKRMKVLVISDPVQ
jgi:thiol-disulfide isomerase/thioredoxin